MKPLLVGDQPSRTDDPYWATPLSGAVAQALCQMAGIPPQGDGSRYGRWADSIYEKFDCINAIERYEAWDSAKAAARLRDVIEPEREVVVLLSRRAQSAYCAMTQPAQTNIGHLRYYEWRTDLLAPTARREVVVIPHPSARNRVYEDPKAKDRAGKVLRQAVDKAAQLHATRMT